jgi:hypothetical protein
MDGKLNGSEILMAMTTKITAFSNVTPLPTFHRNLLPPSSVKYVHVDTEFMY